MLDFCILIVAAIYHSISDCWRSPHHKKWGHYKRCCIQKLVIITRYKQTNLSAAEFHRNSLFFSRMECNLEPTPILQSLSVLHKIQSVALNKLVPVRNPSFCFVEILQIFRLFFAKRGETPVLFHWRRHHKFCWPLFMELAIFGSIDGLGRLRRM